MTETKSIVGSSDLETKKAYITKVFTQAYTEVSEEFPDIPLLAKEALMFAGFYEEDSNNRASNGHNGKGGVYFNEKYLTCGNDEIERLARHEAQHERYNLQCGYRDNPEYMWLFVFHPSFTALHSRMKDFYGNHKANGYPFEKDVKDLPKEYSDMENGRTNYAHPDEILALLRGYETYLQQMEDGVSVTAEPYEFIGAFEIDDLKLLDGAHRQKIAMEVLEVNKDILPVAVQSGISIDID